MNWTFGQLLRRCREEANLTQEKLAEKVSIHASMISRYENDRLPLTNPSIVARMISVIALYGVSREKLNQLWESVGYVPVEDFDSGAVHPSAYPIVRFINQVFEELHPEEAQVLSQDLNRIIEIDQAFFSSLKALERRKWQSAADSLLSLRDGLERDFINFNQRIDEPLADSYYGQGLYSKAVGAYQLALLNTQERDTEEAVPEIASTQGQILMKLGDAYRRLARWDDADDCYQQAKKIFEELNSSVRVADCLRKTASLYIFRGLAPEALPLCKTSLDIYEEEGDDGGVYKAMQHKAWAYDMLGQWDQAIQLYEEALALAKSVAGDEWELLKAHRYLADAYRLARKIAKAERSYQDALDIAERLQKKGNDTKLMVGMIWLGLGQVYLKQRGREPDAQRCLNRSLTAHLSLQEDFRVAVVQNELGNLLARLGRSRAAEMRLRQASDSLRLLGSPFFYIGSLVNLCELYYEKKDFEEVYRTAEEARRADNGLVNVHLARIESLVGRARIGQGQYLEGARALCIASEKALAFNEYIFREILQSLLGEIDRLVHNTELKQATALCQSYKEFWQSHKVTSGKRELVKESLVRIGKEEEKIRALAPAV